MFKPETPTLLVIFPDLNIVVVLVALILECCGADLPGLVHQVHGEELSAPAGLVPRPDVRLGGHANLNRSDPKRYYMFMTSVADPGPF
jgi:hypothetical protein